GSGGQGRLVERRKGFSNRFAVGALDDFASNGTREGRHAVLQLGQLDRDVRRQQIAPRGDRLAEFHENRSQLLQCEPQPLAAVGLAAALEPNPGREKEEKAQWTVQVGGPDEIVQPVFQQNTLDLEQPCENPNLHWRVSRSMRAARRSTSSRNEST